VIERFTPQSWLAIGLMVVAAAIVTGLTGAPAAGLVSLVAGVAAVLTAIGVRESDAPVEAVAKPAPDLSTLAGALEAIVEPVLVLRASQVAVANTAARALLGEHVVGEDARLAIRHPAAAELLAEADGRGSPQPIDLVGLGVGLGTVDQRWRMRVTALDDGVRLVHLADQTGNYAAERMRVDFVANASHELRTPLASIIGYSETLADAAGEDEETRQRFLKIVLDAARRMERLVEDLMSLSRIEAEKFRLPATLVDPARLVREARDALADAHDGRGRDITVSIDEDIPPVAGDAGQLSQLLHNLIGNAMKYGRAGTPIAVRLTRQGAVVKLIVSDQGDGIAPEHLPRLTERFYRVDAGRSRSLGGTGLGLAIVKHIVERHRGRLDIASRPGEGTRVTVTLRAADAPAGAAVTKP
jgi:two-component system phosphate regulon sensor histidine kinase PhoR